MPRNLRALVQEKRRGDALEEGEPIDPKFRGWYASVSLPHYDRRGLQQFITFRLHDAMPVSKRSEWEHFLKLEQGFEKQRQIEGYIDRGLGECWLLKHDIAEVVQESLWFRDGIDYRLMAWCVMPNHVHALIEVWTMPMGEILKRWKGFTAKRANRTLKRTGEFWQADYFDQFVRDDDHQRRIVRYIESNPIKAGLVKEASEWRFSSARYRDPTGRQLTHATATRHSPAT